MNIAILALDGCFDTGLSSVLDALATANELAQLMDIQTTGYQVSVVGMRREVRTAQGLRIPATPYRQSTEPDWVIVPALGYKMPDTLVPALDRPDVCDAVVALRDWARGGARIAAACIGTFVLAESGLLDGGEATTTWWLTPLFRQRYPRVRLDAHRMIIPSGKMLTAGAGFSHVDLALWLIRQNNPELASLVARYLIVDNRPSQGAYMISEHLAHADPLIERFDHWVRDRLDQPLTLDAAATALAISKRTLTRRMRDTIGKTPISYIQDLRIERAVHLLRTSVHSVERIAGMVGYADGTTLRTLLRRRLGRGVRELRR
ncbi:helix-turn-helix domain-containing protein [Paraburkholderia sp. NMBU_R16]|uniref:GlxA family transcriptional regulator n=1 Tax=Paraburkholderia sp. NMBU_R16 TaxID=2698676 RepID=UPI001562F89F|nr:helix-turn-helix domain-containing protein [Paraburkholderia sp. NMBU_R16]NRO96040.1 helix-turn-helix domain-containing protein [Paraburkholderia sp. NMBU_R16]